MLEAVRLGERILNPQSVNLSSMLKVFAQNPLAVGFESRRNDQSVVPRNSVFLCDS
jgi:hypothetical protein